MLRYFNFINQSEVKLRPLGLARMHFPALVARGMNLLRVLIGSLDYLWLVIGQSNHNFLGFGFTKIKVYQSLRNEMFKYNQQ